MEPVRSVARRSSLNLGSPAGQRSRSAERSHSIKHAEEFDFESKGSFDSTEMNGNGGNLLVPALPSRERLSSESSLSKSVRYHRRTMSDPFDTPDCGGITDGDLHHEEPVKDYGLLEEQEHALPTLARFPFAETNDKNCWSEPPVNIFSVRGPNYLSKKKKVTAERYLLRARGCDLFLADKPSGCNMAR